MKNRKNNGALVLLSLFLLFHLRLANANSDHAYHLENGNKHVFLFGVDHANQAKGGLFNENLYNRFKNSTALFVEFDFHNRTLLTSNLKRDANAGELGISAFVEDDELKKLHQYAQTEVSNFQLTVPAFGALNTCVAALLLSPKSHQPKPSQQLQQYPSYEQYFLQISRKVNVPVTSLEPEGVSTSCQKLSKNEVRTLLLTPAKLKEKPEFFSEYLSALKKSNDLYVQGNGDLAYDMFFDAFNFSSEYKKVMLRWNDDRNIQMMKQIRTALESKDDLTIFVVIGAWHVYGETGILRQLKNDHFQQVDF
jgi:uncharacterized protein YbaP (TraB family)